MSATQSLIYADESVVAQVGDAVVTIEFDPKRWTCDTYGVDHSVSLSVKPSWSAEATEFTATAEMTLSKNTIKNNTPLSVDLTATTSCSAEIYPTIKMYVIVQQENVGTFNIELDASANVAKRVKISAVDGKIINITE